MTFQVIFQKVLCLYFEKLINLPFFQFRRLLRVSDLDHGHDCFSELHLFEKSGFSERLHINIIGIIHRQQGHFG